MKKRVIYSELDAPAASFAPPPGLELSGDIVSRPLINAEESRGLSLWRHELPPGARIAVRRPEEAHAFYAVNGSARVGEKALPSRGAACLAVGAVADIEAGPNGVTLLHYLGDASERPDKSGGCVHVTGEKGQHMIEDEVSNHIFFADSQCPNCSIWLHSQMVGPGRGNPLHRHAEDEIIVVVDGMMNVGTVEMPTGRAISIPKDAHYSFVAGPQGLTFLNFRQVDPYLQLSTMPKTDWLGVRDLMLAQHGGMSIPDMLGGGVPIRVI
jgi:quercetin dioxygenase-like cupin family protein